MVTVVGAAHRRYIPGHVKTVCEFNPRTLRCTDGFSMPSNRDQTCTSEPLAASEAMSPAPTVPRHQGEANVQVPRPLGALTNRDMRSSETVSHRFLGAKS